MRGFKKTLWEGGIRTPAFVTGGYLDESTKGTKFGNNGEFMHVVDWYPTLLGAAGITPSLTKSTSIYDTSKTAIASWEDRTLEWANIPN